MIMDQYSFLVFPGRETKFGLIYRRRGTRLDVDLGLFVENRKRYQMDDEFHSLLPNYNHIPPQVKYKT